MIVVAVAMGLYVRSQDQPAREARLRHRGVRDDRGAGAEAASEDGEPAPLADLRLRRRAPAHLALQPRPPYKRLWTIDAHDTLEFPPTIGYGQVYLAQQKGLFFALNAETGRVRWRKSLGRCAASSPTIGRGVVYQSYMHRVVCAQDQAGRRRLRRRLGRRHRPRAAGATRPRRSSPRRSSTATGSTSAPGTTACTRSTPRTGTRIWRFQADNQVNTSAAYWQRPHLHRLGQRHALLAQRQDREAALELGQLRAPSSGTPRRRSPTAASTSAIPTARCTCTARRRGRLLWARPLGSYIYGAAAVYKRKVFVGTYDGKFYALDAATGDVSWQIDAHGAVHAAPTVMSGLVYYAVCSSCGSEAQRIVARGPDATYAVRARDGHAGLELPGRQVREPGGGGRASGSTSPGARRVRVARKRLEGGQGLPRARSEKRRQRER